MAALEGSDEAAARAGAGPIAADGSPGLPTAPRRYRDVLRRRDLRLLIASLVVDQVGNWSCFVVISVYVFDRTHSTQWLAGLGICRFGPGLLLASYGGVLADRYQRGTVLIVSALAHAVITTGLAVAVGGGSSLGPVLALPALSSVATIPYRPPP